MKGLLLSTLLFSVSAFATNINVSTMPSSPIVISANSIDKDGQELVGPWFSFKLAVTNMGTEEMTLVQLGIETTMGISVVQMDVPVDVKIRPGQMEVLGPFYVSDLPKSSSFVYDVNAHLMGWVGPDDNPTDRVDETITFQTK